MLPDGEKTTPGHDLKEDAGVQDHDPYLVSLVSLTQDSEQPQSEAIKTVIDELQGTALRRRTQLLKPDS
jgi:hypothetical protein